MSQFILKILVTFCILISVTIFYAKNVFAFNFKPKERPNIINEMHYNVPDPGLNVN